MAVNVPPTTISPKVFIRHLSTVSGAAWTDLTTVANAQVLSIDQRPGAQLDSARVRLPLKRLGYFDSSDSQWTASDFDEVMISLGSGAGADVFGTARNFIRKFQDNDEVVEFNVINGDFIQDAALFGQLWGYASGTSSFRNPATTFSSPLIFNKGGLPNMCTSATTARSTTVDFSGRFWGGTDKQDATAGYWNPIWAILYIMHNKYPYGNFSTSYNDISAKIDTGADWVSTNWTREFPEFNVNGLTWARGIERILRDAGGYQFQLVRGDTSAVGLGFFRTFPPYAADQNEKTLYLRSTGSTLAMTSNNVIRGRLNRDSMRRVTHFIGLGAPKRYLATIKLEPGWEPSLTDAVIDNTDLLDRSKSVYDPLYDDAMRRWIRPRSGTDLNTLTGLAAAGSAPYGPQMHTAIPNMAWSYTSGVTNDDTTTHLRPLLSYVSFGGSTARMVDLTWGLLPDALGIYIGGSGAKLAGQAFTANTSGSNGGTLNTIYLTAVIPADDRLTQSAINSQAINGTAPDIFRALGFGREYQYEAPAPSCGDYSTGGNRRILIRKPNSSGVIATLPTEVWVDNSSGLSRRVKDELAWRDTSADVGFVVMPWIETVYDIGDIIGSVYDKHIVLNSVVVAREWDFENQTTTLQLSDERYSFKRPIITEAQRRRVLSAPPNFIDDNPTTAFV